MITDDRFRAIAQRLLEKSRANEVQWSPSELPHSTNVRAYSVRLPESVVSVQLWTPETEPNHVCLLLSRPDGLSVGRWVVHEDDKDWELVLGLFNEADRFVVGWDRVLSDVEKVLQHDGVIGEHSARNPF